jgi:hypothetical protein
MLASSLWVGASGCGDGPDPGQVCADAIAKCGGSVEIDTICSTAGKCTVDGAAFTCSGACNFPVGHTVVIDLTSAHLTTKQTDLSVLVVSEDAQGRVLEMSDFDVRLDGIRGAIDDDATGFDFFGHKGSPRSLKITAQHAKVSSITAHLSMRDAACERMATADTPECAELE